MNPLKESTLEYICNPSQNLENCNFLIESNRIQLAFCSIKVDKSLFREAKIHITAPWSSFDASSRSANWAKMRKRWNKSYPGILKETCRSYVFLRIQSFEEKSSWEKHLPSAKLLASKRKKAPWQMKSGGVFENVPKRMRSVACSSTADASLRTYQAQNHPQRWEMWTVILYTSRTNQRYHARCHR